PLLRAPPLHAHDGALPLAQRVLPRARLPHLPGRLARLPHDRPAQPAPAHVGQRLPAQRFHVAVVARAARPSRRRGAAGRTPAHPPRQRGGPLRDAEHAVSSGRLRCDVHIRRPPPATRTPPLTCSDSGRQKRQTAPAASSGVPTRPSGISCFRSSACSASTPTLKLRFPTSTRGGSPSNVCVSRVWMKPNATQLTVTFQRPQSFASERVMPTRADLAAE